MKYNRLKVYLFKNVYEFPWYETDKLNLNIISFKLYVYKISETVRNEYFLIDFEFNVYKILEITIYGLKYHYD